MLFLLNLLGIGTAYATDGAAPAAGSSGLISMLPIFIMLFLFMYLLVIRPQTKRAKEQKNLLSNLQKGDEVLTSGGIIGKIEKITDNFIVLNIAENININVQKPAVVSSLPKGTIKTID